MRFHLLAYPQDGGRERRGAGHQRAAPPHGRSGAELLVSLRLLRDGAADTKVTIPVAVRNRRGPLRADGGHGRAAVGPEGSPHPAGSAAASAAGGGCRCRPTRTRRTTTSTSRSTSRPARRALIVADDASAARPLQLAAGDRPEPALRCAAEIIAPEQLGTVEWDTLALVLWQAPLPAGDAAQALDAFVRHGGQVLFFPPRDPGDDRVPRRPLGCLVARTQGRPRRELARRPGLAGPHAERPGAAAGQSGGAAVLRAGGRADAAGDAPRRRAAARAGGHRPGRRSTSARRRRRPGDSSLAIGGVVLYVCVAAGCWPPAPPCWAIRGNSSPGRRPARNPTTWQRVAGNDEALSTEYAFHRGVYAAGSGWLSVNRAAAEDDPAVVPHAAAGRAVSRPGLRPRGRPGGQPARR